MANETFTVTVPRTYTFREGWGVTFTPVWSDDDGSEWVSDVLSNVVRIAHDTVTVLDLPFGAMPVVRVTDGPYGCYAPVENFRELDDSCDDTHDLRARWFATEEDAREHARYTVNRFDHPQVWESFVAF